MSRIYICQEYGGKLINKILAQVVHATLSTLYPEHVFISPILMFGHLYKKVDYDKGMEYCLSELKTCDKMITLGKRSNSKGCIIEKQLAKDNDILITDIEFNSLKSLMRAKI